MARKLIVGLGNPGPEYELNRHNLGFIVVDNLACKYKIDLSKKKELCVTGSGKIEGEEVMLAKPQTFMNKSGLGVARLLQYYKFALEDLIVIHDDLDIEFGRVKIKIEGGHGGHNGIRSIIHSLPASDFTRIRVGIGRPPGRMSAEKYVLTDFSETDDELNGLIELCMDAVATLLTEGHIKAMNRFH